MYVIKAYIKPIDKMVYPQPWEEELACQEVLIDVHLQQLIEFPMEYGIWVKTFEGQEECITKRHLCNWEIINWNVESIELPIHGRTSASIGGLNG